MRKLVSDPGTINAFHGAIHSALPLYSYAFEWGNDIKVSKGRVNESKCQEKSRPGATEGEQFTGSDSLAGARRVDQEHNRKVVFRTQREPVPQLGGKK